MKFKPVFFFGTLILFLGVLWMFLPHFAHDHVAEEFHEGAHHASHYENLVYGVIAIFAGISLMMIHNKYEHKKIPSHFLYLSYLAASLSLSAGLIHAALIPAHLREWLGYGIFFIVVALGQIVYSVILGKSKDLPQYFYILGIVGNLAVIFLYIITRTIGIPFFGPQSGEIEAFAPIDVLSKIIEIWLVVTLCVLVRKKN